MEISTVLSAYNEHKEDFFSFLKGTRAELANIFDIGLSKYLANWETKISNTNTFLSPLNKIKFSDTFFPITILDPEKHRIAKEQLLEELEKRTHVIGLFGTAGSGKTMLLKYIFLACNNELHKIPIYIELRDLQNVSGGFEDYIAKLITNNAIKPSEAIFKRALDSGKFIFLLDGFDEIQLTFRNKFIYEFELFIDQYTKNSYIITSRPGAALENLPRVFSYHILPLNDEEINTFIDKQKNIIKNDDLIFSIKESIKSPQSIEYIEYLKNPLLLSMFILTFARYPELPKQKSKFYWNVYDTLCTRHGTHSKKGGYIHQRKSLLDDRELEDILRFFSTNTVLENRFSFDLEFVTSNIQTILNHFEFNVKAGEVIYDFVVSISILILDGHEYKFPHRTLQDYFFVQFIKHSSEELKKEIYQNYFPTLFNNYATNETLYQLCDEIDELAFNRYFYLPLLEKFRTEIGLTLDVNSAINLCRYGNIIYKCTINEWTNIAYIVSKPSTLSENLYFGILGKNMYSSTSIMPDSSARLDNNYGTEFQELLKRKSYKSNATILFDLKNMKDDEILCLINFFNLKKGLFIFIEHIERTYNLVQTTIQKIEQKHSFWKLPILKK